MLIRLANFETASIVLISVIALFFFPAPRGSFTATHGPVAQFRECCEAAFFRVGAALAGLRFTLALIFTSLGNWFRRPSDALVTQGGWGVSVLRI